MQIMKAKDAFKENPTLKCLLFGQNGTGKTEWMARAPMPLIAMNEQQANSVIANINEDALVVPISKWQDWANLVKAVMSAKKVSAENSEYGFPHLTMNVGGQSVDFATFCLDGLTSISHLYISDLFGEKLTNAEPGKEPQLSQPQWGKVINAIDRVGTFLRDLPCNVVATALSKEIVDDNQRVLIRPALYGKVPPTSFGGFFNAVGWAHLFESATRGADPEYRIAFRAGQRIVAKPAPGFPRYITNTQEPGVVTLGSLLMHSYPDAPVAHNDGDDAAHVLNQIEQQSSAPASPSKSRGGASGKGRGRG